MVRRDRLSILNYQYLLSKLCPPGSEIQRIVYYSILEEVGEILASLINADIWRKRGLFQSVFPQPRAVSNRSIIRHKAGIAVIQNNVSSPTE